MAGEAKLQAPNTELPPDTVNQELAPSVTRAADWVSLSQGQLIWRRFKRSRMALYGMVVLIILYTGMLFCEFLSPYLQNKRFTDNIFQPPTLPRWVDAEGQFHLRPFIYKYDRKVNRETLEMTYTADTSKMYPIYFFVQGEPYKFLGVISTNIHLFGINSKEVPIFIWGSDRQGRDLFGRCLYGSRVSLTIGLVGVFLTIIIGTTLGVSSGYYGGRIDDFVQRFSELLMSIPQIPLWMALAAIVPATWPPLWVYLGITIILSLLSWGGLARQLRSKTLSLHEEGFTLATKAAGGGDWWVISRHLIPNNASHIIVVATLTIPSMILAETALSFLGLGIRPPMTSWGVLLEEAQNVKIIVLNPWLLIPAFLVILTVLGYNFLGDGLRDAVDPYAR